MFCLPFLRCLFSRPLHLYLVYGRQTISVIKWIWHVIWTYVHNYKKGEKSFLCAKGWNPVISPTQSVGCKVSVNIMRQTEKASGVMPLIKSSVLFGLEEANPPFWPPCWVGSRAITCVWRSWGLRKRWSRPQCHFLWLNTLKAPSTLKFYSSHRSSIV